MNYKGYGQNHVDDYLALMRDLIKYFPLFQDLKKYRLPVLKADLLAGLTVGVLLIPQSMAYALLAGMPPVTGLYAAIIPLFIYGILGSSRHLSIGPVAITAILILAGVSKIVPPGSADYTSYVILLGLLIGIFQCLLGFLKLGFLTNFISHPVIAGFTAAAAVIIASTQLSDIFGISSPHFDGFFERIIFFVENLGMTNPVTVIFGLGSLIILIALKVLKKNFPASLFVVVAGILVSYFVGIENYKVGLIGTIPSGLPGFKFPAVDWNIVQLLLPTILVVTLIGVVESISIAKSLEAKSRSYDVNADQELLALGLAKIGGSFFQALPSSGSFSRSVVNLEAGGKTGMSSIFSACMVIITVLFLTPLFYFLPKSILAAIILLAISSLIDYRAFIALWKLHKQDFWMMVITFLGTLLIGIEMGVLMGVLMSLLAVVYRSSKPHFVVLGNIPGTDYYRSFERFGELVTWDELLIIRFDEKLYFGNALYFRDKVRRLIANNKAARYVLLDGSNISSIDSTGIDVLRELDIYLSEQHVELHLSGAIGPVRDILHRSGLLKDPDKHHMTIQSGVMDILRPGVKGSEEGESDNWAMQADRQ